MPKPGSRRARLRRAGIRHYDVLIHDQSRHWLRENFSQGARGYPVNVARLMRNIIWQTRERIIDGEKPPMRELIRTFWYTHIKPTLSRVGALAEETDQYNQLIDQIVFMVKEIDVMRYRDIGFRDENQAHRRAGANAHLILFSEKLGHQEFLSEMAERYNTSILALGGQPSVLNIEYFVESLRQLEVNLRQSFYLFSIVDYDPSGWIIRDAFIDDLKFYGVSHTRVIDLITPDMLRPEEIALARVKLGDIPSMRAKNTAWFAEVRKRGYKNQRYLQAKTLKGKQILYGLQAESISGKRLAERLAQELTPFLGKSEDLLQRFELKRLNQTLRDLIVQKVI